MSRDFVLAQPSAVSRRRQRLCGALAGLIMLVATPTGAAAAACVGAPNLQEANDGHWYYRIDRLNHQRCWYLKQESQSAAPSPLESGLTVAKVTTSISSFFTAWKGAGSARSQQDVATVATPPEPSADSSVPKRSISAPIRNRGWALNERGAERFRFHEPAVEHADPQHELDPAQREALFEEFLRWSLKRD